MISVIIPVYNEAALIGKTIHAVKHRSGNVSEIIVVDGGSHDSTPKEARTAGAEVFSSPAKGRAIQMNYGAEQATGEILFFLHADTTPPFDFDRRIQQAVGSDRAAGCFRLGFDDNHFLLDTYAWFTRFDINAFRFGDQGLFISRTIFEDIGGFREDHLVMEDNEIVRRIKKKTKFKVLSAKVITSARKYKRNGVLRLQMVFLLIYILYKLGFSQKRLVKTYQKLIR